MGHGIWALVHSTSQPGGMLLSPSQVNMEAGVSPETDVEMVEVTTIEDGRHVRGISVPSTVIDMG